MIRARDMRKGKVCLHDGELYVCQDNQHVAKGNKRSYMQAKLKNLKSGQTIRRAEFAPDWIVGTNETRDRLFCWPTGKPTSPPTVLPVAQLSGRSIQDVCLVPRPIG